WVGKGVGMGEEEEDALARACTADPEIEVPETEPFTICYTAGTTGKPKGVVISHRSRAITFYLTALEWGLGPGRMTLAVAPMYHGAGFAFAYAACVTGGGGGGVGSFYPELLSAVVGEKPPGPGVLGPSHHQRRGALCVGAGR